MVCLSWVISISNACSQILVLYEAGQQQVRFVVRPNASQLGSCGYILWPAYKDSARADPPSSVQRFKGLVTFSISRLRTCLELLRLNKAQPKSLPPRDPYRYVRFPVLVTSDILIYALLLLSS